MTRPLLVDAFRLCEDVEITAPKWFAEMVDHEDAYVDRSIEDGAVRVYGCTIDTPHGRTHAKVGDYIVRESNGNIRILKAKQFMEQYEQVRA